MSPRDDAASPAPSVLEYASGHLPKPSCRWGLTTALIAFAAVLLLLMRLQNGLREYDSLFVLVIFLAGALTAISGLVDIAFGKSRHSRLGLALSIIALALGISASAGSVLLPMPCTGCRPTARRVQCGSNLRQIGQAMLLYANDHGGRLPATIADLLEEDITAAVLVCPSSNDTPGVPGATTQATAANVLVAGHLSYFILSKGFTNPPPADAVLAYEPLANHGNQGMNVLFGDYHVDFLQTPEANKLLAELNGGHNPPRAEVMR